MFKIIFKMIRLKYILVILILYSSSSSLSLLLSSSYSKSLSSYICRFHLNPSLLIPATSLSSLSSLSLSSSSTSTSTSTSSFKLNFKNETSSALSQPVDYLLLEYLKSNAKDSNKPSYRVCVRALVAVLQLEEKIHGGQGYHKAKQLVLTTKTNISFETFTLLQCTLLSALIQIEDYDNACNHLCTILNDKQIRYPLDINIIGKLFKTLLLQYNNSDNINTKKAGMVQRIYKLLLSCDILKYNSCIIHEYGAKAYMILGDIYNSVKSIERIKIRSYLVNKDIMELSNIVLNKLSLSSSSSDVTDDNLMISLRFALFQPLGALPVESPLLKTCLSILGSSSEHCDIVLRYCKKLQKKGITIDDEIIQSLLFISFDKGASVQDILDIFNISKPHDYKNKFMNHAITTIVDTANLVRDGLLYKSESFNDANDTAGMVHKLGFIKQFAINMVNIPITVADAINKLPNATLSNRMMMMSSINKSLRLLIRALTKVGLSKEGWEILRTIFEYSEGKWIPDLKIVMISLGDVDVKNNINFLKAIIQSGNLPENFVIVAFLASQNQNDNDRHEALQLWNAMIDKKLSNCLNTAVIRSSMELGFSINYETGLKICNDIIDLSFEIYGRYLRSELTRVFTNVFLNLKYVSEDISKAPFDIMQHLLRNIDKSALSNRHYSDSDTGSNISNELVSSIVNIDSLLAGGLISMKKFNISKSLHNINWVENPNIKKIELLDFSKLHKYLEACRLLRSDSLYLISSVGHDWLNVILKCYLKAGQPSPAIDALDRTIEVVGTDNIEKLSRLFSPELLSTAIFLSSSINYNNTFGFQKCKKYYDLALNLNKDRPTNSLTLALLVAANTYNNIDGAFAAMKDKLAVKAVKVTARKARALSNNAFKNGKQVELAIFWEEMHKLYPYLRMQSVPSTELLCSLLIHDNSSSLLSWAKTISDSGAALSPNQLKYVLSRYNATVHVSCLLELLPILSDLSSRYLEPGMPRIPKSVSLNMEQQMISLPLSMTFLTNMVISLLKQHRERDALQLLQCIHPLQWPYDDILSYLASNNKILDVLAVLQKFEELNNNYMMLKESTARTILSLRNDIHISIDDLNSYKDRSRFFHVTIEVDKSLVSKIRESVAKIMTNKFKDDSSATNNKKYELSAIEMKEFDSDYDYISPSKRLGMLPIYNKGTSDLDTILSLLPEDIDGLNDGSAIVDNAYDNIQENLMFLLTDRKNQRLQFDSSLFDKTTIIDDTMANFDDILLKNKNSNTHEKPATTKWIDPESPENVMTFIVDVESLGRQKDEYFKKVDIKDGTIAGGNIHVAAQKKYWKNHLRNNMKIANANANQLDVEDIIIKELARSILVSAKNDLLSDYSSSSSFLDDDSLTLSPTASSVTISTVSELFNKRGAQLFASYPQLANELTETLLKLCSRSADLDLSCKIIDSLVTNEQFELLQLSMESIHLLIHHGTIQKRFQKVATIFEHIQPSLMKWLKDLSNTSIIDHKDCRFSILEDCIIAAVKARRPSAGNIALEVVSMLIKLDYKIDRIMIMELLASMVQLDADNELSNSLELLNIMLKMKNVQVSNSIYEELIGKLLRRKQLDLSVMMIKYLHSKNYLVSMKLYKALITELIQDDDANDKMFDGLNEATLIIKEVKRISPDNSGSKILSDLLLNRTTMNKKF